MDRFEFKHGGMTTDANGRWVTYNDHLLEVVYLREEVRKQAALVQALRDEKSRQFVMSAAADGTAAGQSLAFLESKKKGGGPKV